MDAARTGVANAAIVDGWGLAASPAYLPDGGTGVVLVSLSPAAMRDDWWPRLAAIAGVSVLLLGCAAVASWLLASRTAAPLTALAGTAERVADGDLSARAEGSGVREIDDVGRALNRVTVAGAGAARRAAAGDRRAGPPAAHPADGAADRHRRGRRPGDRRPAPGRRGRRAADGGRDHHHRAPTAAGGAGGTVRRRRRGRGAGALLAGARRGPGPAVRPRAAVRAASRAADGGGPGHGGGHPAAERVRAHA